MPGMDSRVNKAILLFLSVAGWVACGGSAPSSSAQPSAPPSVPGFTLALTPASVTLAQGQKQTVSIAITAQNGFSSAVSVKVGSASGGVTVTPGSLSISPGSPQSVTLAAASDTTVGEQNIAISGGAGSLTAMAQLSLNVVVPPVPDPFHYVGGSLVHGFYDEARQLLFATNPGLNELDVFSGQDFSLKARIPVPQPWGIDQMADGHTLVIGTLAQDIVTVDEDTFAVTLHPSALTTPDFSGAIFLQDVVAMANGKVLAIGGEQGTSSGGYHMLYEWDSATNTWGVLPPKSTQFTTFQVGRLARSADHKVAVFAADQFYLYNSDTDSLTSVPLATVNPPDNMYGVQGYALNSDGSKIAVASVDQLSFFDRSFSLLKTVTIPGFFQSSRSTMPFSSDGQRLYLEYGSPFVIEAVDADSYNALGYFSGDVVAGGAMGRLLATDAAGHAYVGIAGGLRLVDLTQMPVPNAAFQNLPPCKTLEAVLPLGGSQQISTPLSVFNRKEKVYIGGQYAPLSSDATEIQVPASSTPGPADIECIDPQTGNTEVVPGGISYGADPVALNSNLLPTDGNPGGFLYGYGFYSGTELAWTTNPPYTGSVLLGGSPVLNPIQQGSPAYPSTLEDVTFQIPSGTPGENADVSVSSSFGEGTLHSAATYYPAPKLIAATNVLQLLYDPHRNVVYALKPTEIDVLDAASLQWQSPLKFPSSLAEDGTRIGMALSPDGSRLVVVGSELNSYKMVADSQILVLDPAGNASPSLITYTGKAELTGSVAITANNDAILAGDAQTLVLNHADLSLIPIGTYLVSPQIVKASADGLHVYGVDVDITSGNVFSIDPTTYAVHMETFGYMFWSDLVVSPDGAQFAGVDVDLWGGATGVALGLFGSGLQYLNANVYPLLAPPNTAGLLGAVYSPGGKVLVTPERDALEIWDVEQGTLRARILSSVPLQSLTPGTIASRIPELTVDATGQTIYAISGSGILVFSLPAPLDQFPAHHWPDMFVYQSAPGVYGLLSTRMAVRHAKR